MKKMKNNGILAIKAGYNPNSSSVGVAVRIFLRTGFFVALFFSLVGVLISLRARCRNKKGIDDQDQV